MLRHASLMVVLVSCTSDPDTRPATADYVIDAILVPYCGRGGCHSTDTAAANLVFDTVDAAHAALKGSGKRGKLVVPMMPDRSRLVTVLRDSNRQMPPDIPLPDADVELIRLWITDGAGDL